MVPLIPGTLFVVAMVALSTMAQAQGTLYKVVDAQGNVTYQDQPPAEDAGSRTESLTVEEPAAATPAANDGQRDRVLAAAQSAPLVLFTVPNCDTCDFVRWFLDERELPFEEVDVQGDIENQQRLRDATGEYRVPVVLVGEQPLFGFDRDELLGVLAGAGYLPADSIPVLATEGEPTPGFGEDAGGEAVGDEPLPQAQ